MSEMLPLFLNLAGRQVVLVGGGRLATLKLSQLLASGALVRVVSPEISEEIVEAESRVATRSDRPVSPEGNRLHLVRRGFEATDLDGAWLVVTAATPEVNRQVAEAAEARRLFVNAVDDPVHASAFLSGIVRRGGVTLAISTEGHAPALTALLREGLDAVLPSDLETWMDHARRERAAWRADNLPFGERKPRLLRALNELYEAR